MFLAALLLLLPLLSSPNRIDPVVLNQNTSCSSDDIQYPFAPIFDTGVIVNRSHLLLSLPQARPGFEIYCSSASRPMLLLGGSSYEVLNVSVLGGFVRVAGRSVADHCPGDLNHTSYGLNHTLYGLNHTSDALRLEGTPYTFSDARNRFTAIGCDAMAMLHHRGHTTGCVSFCGADADTSSCSGLGCCQAAIPSGMKSLELEFRSVRNVTGWRNNSGPCSRAFIIDKDWFRFSKEDLVSISDDSYRPVVLDWWIGGGTCEEAKMGGGKDYACKEKSECFNSTNGGGGYRCRCLSGYSGNPYIRCEDIDECSDPKNNPCEGKCINTNGNFTCSCPWGSQKHGTRCKKIAPVEIVLGVCLGFLVLLLTGSTWTFLLLKKHKAKQLKQKHFLQNGGLLLRQQISAREVTARIFTSDELEKATDGFHESRVLGRGGYGLVYKGILPPAGTIVAIKKSKLVDEGQIEQFINEVVILSQVRHRHVVKLLGCCLETPVPLLVYEFIPNSTLFHHLHHRSTPMAYISWEIRLRIAVETAAALAYLHCIAVVPIIHRDVKSANILLDEEYRAKVSDFGASRLVPYNHTHITTIVQGTLGYLDPEYFQTSMLTDRSDVYSFGVVLVELMTREKPIVMEKSLVHRFVTLEEENRVLEAMDEQTVRDAGPKHLLSVANLARRCLSLKGEERPPMKEVAVELDALRRLMRLQIVRRAEEERSSLLRDSAGTGIREVAREYSAEALLLASAENM